MQTRATLALSMHMRYIQFWKILCYPLVLKVIYKVFLLLSFNSSCCLHPLPRPKNFLYKELIIIHSWPWGMRGRVSLCVWVYLYVQGRKGKRSFNKVQQNRWFGHEKQCQGPVLNFNCTTLRKKKKGVSFENEATLQVKVGGFLVCLSHFCWRPRILLYNGLSTFFITI